MANGIKNNKAAVMKQFDANVARTLEALGMEFTGNAATEMDIGIYNAPISDSGYQRTELLLCNEIGCTLHSCKL